MKKSKTFFACAMLAALASCSNDHVLSQQSPTPSDPDVINIVAASSKPVTRAVENGTNLQNTQFATGEKINVYLGENVTSSTTSYDLYRYKVTNTAPSGGSGKVLELNTTDYSTQTAPHYPITGNGMDAYALYPALGSSESAYEITDQTRTFSVAENQKDDADYRKSDLMFGTSLHYRCGGGIFCIHILHQQPSQYEQEGAHLGRQLPYHVLHDACSSNIL